jgi:hypothetical protein
MSVIERIERVLRRIGVLPKFEKDDVINATIDHAARDHENIVDKLHNAMTRRMETNEALRRSIQIAKQRTNSFEAFERMAKMRRENSSD